MRCGQQVEEVLKQHTNLNKTERRQEVLTLFEQVKLPNPTVFIRLILMKFQEVKNSVL